MSDPFKKNSSALIYFEGILIKLCTAILKYVITLKMLTQIFFHITLFCECQVKDMNIPFFIYIEMKKLHIFIVSSSAASFMYIDFLKKMY